LRKKNLFHPKEDDDTMHIWDCILPGVFGSSKNSKTYEETNMTQLGEEGPLLPESGVFYGDEEQFQQALQNAYIMGLWDVGLERVPRVPQPKARPYRWRWQDLSRLSVLSWRFVPVEQGPSRRIHGRVLALVNPASKNFGTTDTLFAGIQSLLPGETVRAHRHSMQAIRFILAGQGASTTVDGERMEVGPGDFILTPGWMWHQHHNASSGSPMIWFDGLDLPLVNHLAATFFELYGEDELPVRASSASAGLAAVGLRPAHWQSEQGRLLHYPWAQTRQALETYARETKTGVVEMEFIHPLTGGAVLPTMSCGMIRMEPGAGSRRRREVASTIMVVFAGRGYSLINGERFSWEQGDVLAIPSWVWFEHLADPDPDAQPAVLFTMTDRPALQALGLYRCEEASACK
jgi:gentisate 1,2-dioxygenase